jgi:hypothetical protein
MYIKEKQVIANMKYREKHYDKWLEMNRKVQDTWYENHKEEKKKKTLANYYYKKECQILRNISIF